MTKEEMNKMERLAEIMFQEDEYRYNNNQDLMYHTKEDFEAEEAEREEKRKVKKPSFFCTKPRRGRAGFARFVILHK